MAVNSVRGVVLRLPPLPELVHPQAESSDPGQAVRVDEKGLILLTGVAAGAGGSGSQLTLRFDGLELSVAPPPGTSAEQTAHLLERVMPPAYRLNLAARRGQTVVLELVRSPRAHLAPRREEDRAQLAG